MLSIYEDHQKENERFETSIILFQEMFLNYFTLKEPTDAEPDFSIQFEKQKRIGSGNFHRV